jgi:hypothetical protein
MGRWNAAVLRATRKRKKRYWRTRGWVLRRVAFVGAGGAIGVLLGWERGMGGESFSMRAQVR